MLAALVVVIAGLKVAESLFIPILIAFFIATVSFPVLNFLRKKGIPRPVAVLLTVGLDFIFLAALAVLAVTLVGDLQEKWNDRYASEFSGQIVTASNTLAEKLKDYGVPNAQEKINEAVNNNLTNLQNILGSQSALLVLTLGLLISLSAGEFDLSIGASFSLGASVLVWLDVDHG